MLTRPRNVDLPGAGVRLSGPAPARFRPEGRAHGDGDRRPEPAARVANDTTQEAAFQGFGCATAIASAALMTESVTRKTLAEAPVDDLGDL